MGLGAFRTGAWGAELFGPEMCEPRAVPGFVYLFAATRKDLEREMAALVGICGKNSAGVIWVSWYEKSSGRATGLTADRPAVSREAGGLFLVFFRKPDAHRNADKRRARKEDDPGTGCFGTDMTMNEQDRSYDHIEQSPKDIDEGGGQSLTRRFRKRGREFVATDPLNKMRDGVGQKYTGEKSAEIDAQDH